MKFVIPHHLHNTLEYLVEQFNNEFTLFGKTRIDYETEEIHLEDIRVPKQDSTGGTTEFDPSDFMDELLNDGEDPTNWNMWIHSHVKMGAFWSGTDEDTMQSFNRGATEQFFHMVISERGRKACYTMYKPFVMKMDNVKIEIDETNINNKKLEKLLKQHKKLKELCEEVFEKIKEEKEEDKVSENSLDLEKQLEDKNELRKFKKDKKKKQKGFWPRDKMTGEEMYDDVNGVGEKYNVFMYSERAQRISDIRRYTMGHKGTCTCALCLELSHLITLRDTNVAVTAQTLNNFIYGNHKANCDCPPCQAGRAISRIHTFQVEPNN